MKKFLADTYLLGRNELVIQLRNPLWLFFGLLQPVIYLALFAPFLTGIAHVPGFPAENAIQFFAPGLLIMNALLVASYAGFDLINRLRSGFIERIRVAPVSRLAIVLGFVLRIPIVLVVQSALLVATALLFGLRIGAVGTLVLTALLTIIGIAVASFSYAVALIVKSEAALSAITNFFTLPLVLLSGVMLPVAFAPAVLRALAHLNPFTYAVDAARALLSSSLGDASIPQAFTIFSALSAAALWTFIKAMREAVA